MSRYLHCKVCETPGSSYQGKEERGNGVCRVCSGFGMEFADVSCKGCEGTGACRTCKGKGFIEVDDDCNM